MVENEKIDATVRDLAKKIAELKNIRNAMRELYIPTNHGQTLIDIFGNDEDKKGLENDKQKLKELQAQEKAIMAELEGKKELFDVSVFNLVKSLNSYICKDVNPGSKRNASELMLETFTEKGVVKCKIGVKQIRNSREFVLPTAVVTGVKKRADKNEILTHGSANIMNMMCHDDFLADNFTKVYLNAIRTTLADNAKGSKKPSEMQ